MARLKNPVLFSQHFGIAKKKFEPLSLFDPILNADTRLGVDPLLLRSSSEKIISTNAVHEFETYFGKIIKLLKKSKYEGDKCWVAADKLLSFNEPKETCLGYSEKSISGSAIGPELRRKLLKTAKEIVDLGVEDPEFFALLGLLEDQFGPDRISDLTTHAIWGTLLEFNQQIASKLKLPTENFTFDDLQLGANLVRNPYEKKKPVAIILVPQDILRDLPVASDWSEVADAASKNSALRHRVNKYIGDIWAIRTKKEKEEARAIALSSKQAFEALLASVDLCNKKPYDAKADANGHYLLRVALSEIEKAFPLKIAGPKNHSLQELEQIVITIVENFKDLIEKNGLWYLLWDRDNPRHERAAQKLFLASRRHTVKPTTSR